MVRKIRRRTFGNTKNKRATVATTHPAAWRNPASAPTPKSEERSAIANVANMTPNARHRALVENNHLVERSVALGANISGARLTMTTNPTPMQIIESESMI